MKTKFLFLSALAMTIFSCTNDSSSDVAADDNITHFITSRYHVTGGNAVIQSQVDYTVTDGKYDFYTGETFENGVSAGSATNTDFIYQNGLLASQISNPDDSRHFFYDAQDKLIGADRVTVDPVTGVSGTLHYRFVHHPGNIVYCERMSSALPDAVISHRVIMDFDADDNLVSAGFDADIDGTAENVNTYTTVNNDITGVVLASGENITYTYASIVDNQHFLVENSYGKQVNRLLCSEGFAGTSIDYIKHILNSRHLFADEVPLATYEINASNNFIKKKTTVEPSAVSTTEIQEVTEYFFD